VVGGYFAEVGDARPFEMTACTYLGCLALFDLPTGYETAMVRLYLQGE